MKVYVEVGALINHKTRSPRVHASLSGSVHTKRPLKPSQAVTDVQLRSHNYIYNISLSLSLLHVHNFHSE